MIHSLRDAYVEARSVKWVSPRFFLGARSGEWTGAKRVSRSLMFDVLRPYAEGDDVRSIDWKSSARSNGLVVRSYHEMRNESLIVLIESKEALRAGSLERLKMEYSLYLGSVLAFAAEAYGATVGILCGDQMSLDVCKKRSAVDRVFGSVDMGASLSTDEYVSMLMRIGLSGASLLCITDGLSDSVLNVISRVRHVYAPVVLRLVDPVEKVFPNVGVTVSSCSSEVRQSFWYADTRSEACRMLSKKKAEYDAELYSMRVPIFEYTLGDSVRSFVQLCCNRRWR